MSGVEGVLYVFEAVEKRCCSLAVEQECCLCTVVVYCVGSGGVCVFVEKRFGRKINILSSLDTVLVVFLNFEV